MYSRVKKVLSFAGLHARSAAVISRVASDFHSDIRLLRDEDCINVKSVIELLAAGIKYGTDITIEAEGQDEKAAVDALVEVLDIFNQGTSSQ